MTKLEKRILIGPAFAVLPAVACLLIAGQAPAPPFRFTQVTAESGLEKALHERHIHAITWGDFDGDGRLDLFLGNFATHGGSLVNVLMRQTQPGKFERFPSSVIEARSRCSGAVFADLDNDGDLDLYASSNTLERAKRPGIRGEAEVHGSQLFRNDGNGRFVDISKTCGACPPTLYHCRDIGVFDYDNDGLLDLLVLQDTVVRRDGRVYGSRLFRNRGGLQFEDVTVQAGLPADLWGFGIAVADLNGDRRPDFFVCGSNRLFLSQPDKTYKEAESLRAVFEHRGKELDSVTGAVFGDLDLDGDMDLVTGPHPYYVPARVHVYLNEGLKDGVPRFREITRDLGIPEIPQKAPHPEIQDFDNDGIPDLFWSVFFAEGKKRWPFICKGLGVKDGLPRFAVPSIAGIKAIYRDGDKMIENVIPERGVGMVYYVTSPAVDYDNDGNLDLLAGNWPPEKSHLYRNDTQGGNWLQVRVQGKTMNRMGVGARVRLFETDSRRLLGHQEITLNGGYSCGRPAMVHFGLGRVEVCNLEVTFPSRLAPLVLKNVNVNRRLTIHEP